MDQDQVAPITQTFSADEIYGTLYFRDQTNELFFKEKLKPVLTTGNILKCKSMSFCLIDETNDNTTVPGHINLIYMSRDKSPERYGNNNFDTTTYFKHLTTDRVGQFLIYFKNIPSTMDVVHELNPYFSYGLVVIAETQTKGRGRGGTSWVSPAGCAMFTFNLKFPPDSEIDKYPAFLGYITSNAVIEAVKSNPGCENLDIKIKWPNDIYTSEMKKVGGILHDFLKSGAVIGCGLNMFNQYPSVCLHDIIYSHNEKYDTNICSIPTDIFIAKFMNSFEQKFDHFQKGDRTSLSNSYIASWIHQDQVACHVTDEFWNKVTVRGLDENGYLLVEKEGTGCYYSISPKGMSYDVIENKICEKNRKQT